MTSDEEGNLTLAWQEADQSMYSVFQEVYTCDEQQLSDLELIGLQTLLTGGTRPAGTEDSLLSQSIQPHPVYT